MARLWTSTRARFSAQMNLLLVTQAPPNPNGAGWERRAAQHLRALCLLGKVTVVLPWSEQADAAVRANWEAMCIALGAHAVIYRTNPSVNEAAILAYHASKSRLTRMWRALQLTAHFDARAQKDERRGYRARILGKFDFVLCFRIESAIWLNSVLEKAQRPPGLLDFDDIESLMFEQTVLSLKAASRFWHRKLRQNFEALKRTEHLLAKDWQATSLCSEVDSARFERIHGVAPLVIPNGYHFTQPPPEAQSDTVELLFVGSFTHVPNVNGILWFLREVWPLIREGSATVARLKIVGFKPPSTIMAYNDRDGISVVADAPDVGLFYDAANIVIAPLLQGSGTRVKLIEAAARGRAIVCTSVACDGLGFVDGEHAAITNDGKSFSDRILMLAGDRAMRTRLAASAHRHALATFEATAVEQRLADHIRTLISDEANTSDQLQ